MDLTKAWAEMFTVYTDGDNVWAMRGGVMLASRAIGQDVDGLEAALDQAVRDLVRDIQDSAVLA